MQTELMTFDELPKQIAYEVRRSPRATWYRGLGFEVVRQEFIEDGIPHMPMRLRR